MPTYRARVTAKGQITVPRQVRQALGVGDGDDVVFEVGPGGIVVKPFRTISHFRDFEGKWRQGYGVAPEQTDAWLREMRGHQKELR